MRLLALFSVLLAASASAQDLPLAPVPALPSPSSDATFARGGDALEISGRWAYGPARGIAVAGGQAVSMQGSVFQTLDVTDEGEFAVRGELVLPGVVLDVAGGDDALAVVSLVHAEDTVHEGTFLIDVSDPEAPTLRGGVTELVGSVVEVRDGIAYVATLAAPSGPDLSLRILSLADPDAPVEIGMLELVGPATDLTLSGDRLYLALEGEGLVAVDVSDPAAPALATSPTTEFTAAVGASQVDDTAVLAVVVRDSANEDMLRVYDISDPDAPALLGDTPLRGVLTFGDIPMDVVWAGTDIAIATAYNALQFVDASDPTSLSQPRAGDTVQTSVAFVVSGTIQLALLDSRVLAVDIFSGLHAVDAASRTRQGVLRVPNLSLDVSRDADTGALYVANGTYGIARLEQTGGDGEVTLTETGRAHGPMWNYTTSVAQTASHVYAADGFGGVWAVDKATMTPSANVGRTSIVRRVAVTEGGAFLLALTDTNGDGEPNGPVLVYSLADPASPVLVSTSTPPAGASDADGRGNIVWISDFSGSRLRFYDLTDPVSPTLVANVPLMGTGPYRLETDGSRVYALRSGSIVTIVDVADPMAPSVVGDVESILPFGGLAGNGPDLALAGAGLALYDVTDPAATTERAYLNAFGDDLLDAAFADPDLVVAAGGSAGVYAVAVLEPIDPITLAEARAMGVGATVRIQGTVSRAMGDFVYLQDDTAGLTIRQTGGPFRDLVMGGTIVPGTTLDLTGTLSEFNNLLQINGDDLAEYEVTGSAEVPQAQLVTLAGLAAGGEDFEGELVTVRGVTYADAGGTFEAGTNYDIFDGTNPGDAFTLRVSGEEESAAVGQPIPAMTVEITGVVGQFRENYQILPIQARDVNSGPVSGTLAEARAMSPGETVRFQGTVSRAMGAFVYLQDETGGLAIRQTSGPFFDLVADGTIAGGTILDVTGTLSEFRTLLQINGDDLVTFEIKDTEAVPDAQVVTLAELAANGEDYESELVSIRALTYADGGSSFEEQTTYNVSDRSDDSNAVGVRINRATETAAVGQPIPTVAVDIFGVVGQFDGAYQVLPIAPMDENARVADATESGASAEMTLSVANPIRARATVRYTLAEAGAAHLVLFDALGRRVATLVQTDLPAGPHEATVDATAFAPGVYVLRLTAGGESLTRRVTLAR